MLQNNIETIDKAHIGYYYRIRIDLEPGGLVSGGAVG
jgi:hypothetical protein